MCVGLFEQTPMMCNSSQQTLCRLGTDIAGKLRDEGPKAPDLLDGFDSKDTVRILWNDPRSGHRTYGKICRFFHALTLCSSRDEESMADEPNKIIYSMIKVSKHYEKKPVLQDISLSYFYGAKIGV